MTSDQIVLDYLRAHGFAAFVEVPKSPPESFVTIDRVGGSREVAVDRPQYAIQCWASSKAKASDLANEVSGAFVYLRSGGKISAAKVSNSYNFPDPDSHMQRYQLTVSLAIRTN